MKLKLASNEKIAERIRTARIAVKKSDEQVMKESGCTQGPYYSYKRGEIPENFRTVLEVGLALDLPPNRLALDDPSSLVEGDYTPEQREHVLVINQLLSELAPRVKNLPLLTRKYLQLIREDMDVAELPQGGQPDRVSEEAGNVIPIPKGVPKHHRPERHRKRRLKASPPAQSKAAGGDYPPYGNQQFLDEDAKK